MVLNSTKTMKTIIPSTRIINNIKSTVQAMAVIAGLVFPGILHAQTTVTPPLQPEVPAQYASLYKLMQQDLDAFTETLASGWNGSKSPMQFAGELYPATSVGGLKGPSSDYFQKTIIPYINALQAVGVKTVKFSINFPILYQPYYNSKAGANNPAAYQQTLSFYQQVVAELRKRGMKVIIPTQVAFPFEYPTITPYLQSLTFAQYCAGRSTLAQTIASQLKPDYLMVQSEPVTEVENTPANISGPLGNMATDVAMVTGILNDLKNAGLRSKTLLVGAGMGTWQPQFDDYLNSFVTLPMDILDVHVYPINNFISGAKTVDYLQRILQMADAAHAHGLRVGMGECWVNKALNNELSQGPYNAVIPSRNVYSFWEPIDQQFLMCMAAAGYCKKFDFIDPSETYYFFAHLDYYKMQPIIAGMSPQDAADTLLDYEHTASTAAIAAGQTTSTGNYYSELIKDGNSSGTKP